MGKKMNLPFLSNQTDHHHHHQNNPLWSWPSCTQTRTLSFGAAIAADDVAASRQVNAPSPSVDPDEAVIRALRSSDSERRLVFVEPGETSSILEEAHKRTLTLTLDDDDDDGEVPFKESVALSLESRNPYLDFKASMAEMVEAHGIKEWDSLEELLSWYLKVNGKDNHGYIIAAFVDLLVGLAFDITAKSNPTCFDCESPYSPLSFCNTSSSSASSSSVSSSSSSSSSTPNCVSSSARVITNEQEIHETSCLSSLLESTEEEINEEEDDDDDDVSS